MNKVRLLYICMVVLLFISCRQQTVINVMDFGAIPDDGKDDTAAIMAAIDKAASMLQATIVFPPGQYDLIMPRAMEAYESMITSAIPGKERWVGPPPAGWEGWPADKNPVILLKELTNVTLDGQGAMLMCHGLCQAIRVENCTNVKIRNFQIDYYQPPFMGGQIIHIGENFIDVKVLNKEVKGGEPFIAFQMYNPETQLPTPVETFAGVQSTQHMGDNVIRLNLTSDSRGIDMPQRVKKGYLLVMRHILGGYEPIEVREGKNILLENIQLYAGNGMGILGVGTEDLTLTNVNVVPKDDGVSLMSTTADATHFIGCRGTVTLNNCTLVGEGDDHFNLHGQSIFVDEIINPKTIKARIGALSGFGMWEDAWVKGWTSKPRVNEWIEFSRTDDLTILGKAKITSLAFDENTGHMAMTFEDAIPSEIEPGFMFQVTDQVPAIRIRDCYFGMNRSRGLLLTSRDIIVEDNVFEYTGGTPIFVCSEIDWKAIPASADVTIRNNTIRDCNYAVGNEKAAITFVFKQGADIGGFVNRVSITDNHISGGTGTAILAQQIRDLSFSGNTIEGFDKAIELRTCENVLIRKNNLFNGGTIETNPDCKEITNELKD